MPISTQAYKSIYSSFTTSLVYTNTALEHILFMYYLCITYVLLMYYLCVTYVLLMYYLCITYVLLMYYLCITYVLLMCYLCITYVLLMCSWCHRTIYLAEYFPFKREQLGIYNFCFEMQPMII